MKNLLKLIALLVLASCSASLQTPSSRMISPEAQGKALDLHLSAGYIGQAEVVKEIGAGTLDDEMDVNRSIGIDYAVEAGVLENLDVYVGMPMFSTPIFGLKYQFMGKPRGTASKGDVSMSVALGGGSGAKKDIDDDVFDFKGNTKVKDFGSNAVEASLLVGKRTHKDVLAFSFLTFTQYRFFGDITSDTASIDGKYFEEEGSVTTLGLGLMRYFKQYTVRLEAVAQKISFDNADKVTLGFAQFSIGYPFQ